MGESEEAVPLLERANKNFPNNLLFERFLAIAYTETGREKDARAILKRNIKNSTELRKMMYFFPRKNIEVETRFADALLKAGVPGKPGGYYKIRNDRKLSQKEIKDLVFGHTVTGFDFWTGKQWWIERTKKGEATFRNVENSYTGKSWVENDMLCNQWQGLYKGMKDCMPVFGNPEPIDGKNEEYLLLPLYGIYPFSVVN